MIADKMKQMVAGSSAVRAMFEEGQRMAEQYGADQVYDFSLGNPNAPAPEGIRRAIQEILTTEDSVHIHGYMNNAGYEEVRSRIAESLNRRFGGCLTKHNLLMTVGAAGGLNVILKTLLNPDEEVIVFAPYFAEYRSYISNYQGVVIEVPARTEDFQLNLEALPDLITEKTRAVIINNPNNPSGVVYSEGMIRKLAEILQAKQEELRRDLYLIADEPYRELVYGEVTVPWLPNFYANTIVGYSFSKSLSLPGERIGYLVMPDTLTDSEDIIEAAAVANRILGFVNAPSLMQQAVSRCLEEKVDVAFYDRNRETLYGGLTECGFSCIKPEGAFYLFVKSPVADEKAFCEAAKNYHLLLVPGSSFACPGYVRLAYCISHETILHALPKFRELAAGYHLG